MVLFPTDISFLTTNIKSSNGLKISVPSALGEHKQRYSVNVLNASSEP